MSGTRAAGRSVVPGCLAYLAQSRNKCRPSTSRSMRASWTRAARSGCVEPRSARTSLAWCTRCAGQARFRARTSASSWRAAHAAVTSSAAARAGADSDRTRAGKRCCVVRARARVVGAWARGCVLGSKLRSCRALDSAVTSASSCSRSRCVTAATSRRTATTWRRAGGVSARRCGLAGGAGATSASGR